MAIVQPTWNWHRQQRWEAMEQKVAKLRNGQVDAPHGGETDPLW